LCCSRVWAPLGRPASVGTRTPRRATGRARGLRASDRRLSAAQRRRLRAGFAACCQWEMHAITSGRGAASSIHWQGKEHPMRRRLVPVNHAMHMPCSPAYRASKHLPGQCPQGRSKKRGACRQVNYELERLLRISSAPQQRRTDTKVDTTVQAPLIRAPAEPADVDGAEPPAGGALFRSVQLSGMPVPFVISAQQTRDDSKMARAHWAADRTRSHGERRMHLLRSSSAKRSSAAQLSATTCCRCP
jgi:hypothetical protein